MNSRLIPLACACLVACGHAMAQTPSPAPAPATATAENDASHEALRALRGELVDAITKGDMDRVLASVTPDVIVTWQNNEVSRGREGLREFFNRMGKDAFKGYKVPPTPDGLTLLHDGDTGISTGETVAAYHLLGSEYEMKSRWTATLVKQNDRWMLAGYHLSMNVLDNPILAAAKGSLYAVSAATLIAGLSLGFLFGRRRRAV